MNSGRNSGRWLTEIVTLYPMRSLAVVGVLFGLTMTLRDHNIQDDSPLPYSSDASSAIIGKASATDGDSLRINDVEIRLWGVDAPELKQSCQLHSGNWPCGTKALAAITERIGGNSVTCHQKDIDRYNRIVAECFVNNASLNQWIVENGWALAYRRYSTKFIMAENKAKETGLGLWQGTFTEPWKWRQQQRAN